MAIGKTEPMHDCFTNYLHLVVNMLLARDVEEYRRIAELRCCSKVLKITFKHMKYLLNLEKQIAALHEKRKSYS